MYTRISMDYDQDNGSFLAGAIFMSNRMTKKECFQRKLFGLPYCKLGFVKNVKMGMILFLFEHEERKLYGVFEAASDGALNIVPEAYLKSGMSFPAQIHFKTIWSCDPLYEDEFGDAIKENYFTPNKFNFALTYNQVIRLIHLFFPKKVNSHGQQNFRAHNKFVQPGISDWDRTKITENRKFIKSERCERKTENDIVGYTRLSDCNIDQSMPCEKPVRSPEDFAIGAQRLYLTVPGRPEPGDPNLICPTQVRGHFPVSSSHDHSYLRDAPSCSMNKQSPDLGMSGPLVQELPLCTISSMENQVPWFRNQLNPLQPAIAVPSSDYLSMDVASNKEECTDQAYKSSRQSLLSIYPELYTDVAAHNGLSLSECYDPSNAQICLPTRGLFASKSSDTLSSLKKFGNGLDLSEASQQDSGSRGYVHRFSSDYIPLSEGENLLKNREISGSPRSLEGLLDVEDSLPKIQEGCNSQGLWSFHSNSSHQYYPIAENSGLCSNSKQERISALHRLSMTPQSRMPHKSYRPEANVSLYDLVGLVSHRTTQRGNAFKVPQQSFTQDADEQLQNTAVRFTEFTSFGVIEQNKEVMTEESLELPFMNFKRRSEARKTDGETEGSSHVEGGGGKIKRRKLVRPSLIEDEPVSKDISVCHTMCLPQENDSTVPVGEGKGSTLNDEKAAISKDKENSVFITGSADIQIINLAGSGSKTRDDEKDELNFDGNLDKFTTAFDVNHAKLSAQNIRSEKAEEKISVVTFEEKKGEIAPPGSGVNYPGSVHFTLEGQHPLGLDIGNRRFSFSEERCDTELDDYISIDVGMS